MNLKNYYYYFTGVLSSKFCDELINYGKQQEERIALTGGFDRDTRKNPLSKKELKNLKKIRYSDVSWMVAEWIYKEIRPYIQIANKEAGWNFEWNHSEACQFTRYVRGQYYGWHCDSNELPYNDPNNLNTHNKIRKLSVTCSLTDPSEYTGGELEFNFSNLGITRKKNMKKCKEILPRGSIVVFPSFVWHRVCPVKKGVRNSLVLWNIGYPFK